MSRQRKYKQKNINNGVHLVFKNELDKLIDLSNYDVFFILNDISHFVDFAHFEGKPVFINSVIDTLSELKTPQSVSRINAWPGFLQRDLWEVASQNEKEAATVFDQIGWETIFVKDEPGLVSARVISMIINEAFFAFGEGVSTIEEIDLSMKLGTNYPYGPFEWAEKIGIKNIYTLLKKLAENDRRYIPSVVLENTFNEK